MARRSSLTVSTDQNLTGLLDVVFQLMTFFIMVSNFNQEVYDQRVKLPIVGSAAPIGDASQDKLVLNMDEFGRLLLNDKVLETSQVAREIRYQADLVRLTLESMGKPVPPGGTLPTTIVLRADQGARFQRVFEVIEACQNQGFVKFDMRALQKAPGT